MIINQTKSVAAPVNRVKDWYKTRAACQRMSFPWCSVAVQESVLQMSWGPFSLSGRYRLLITATGDDSSEIEEVVDITPPITRLGGWIESEANRFFTYRQAVASHDLRLIHSLHLPRQRILISGASGLIGSQVTAFLKGAGHDVWALVRKQPPSPKSISWDPSSGLLSANDLEGFDAVIHLAGESVTGLWTSDKKKRIRDSRVVGTQLLVNTLKRVEKPPSVFIGASAVGYYGDRGKELLTESAHSGKGFIPDICQEWEEATLGAPCSRIVQTRIGVVLSRSGGALAKMLPPFRLGLGGVIGDGTQYLPWISLDDVVYGLYTTLVNESLEGPINLVAPNPVTNATFTKTLGSILHRPTLLPLPARAVTTLMGEMGRELLLSSHRAIPEQLSNSGYSFAYPDLEGCLQHHLGKLDGSQFKQAAPA